MSSYARKPGDAATPQKCVFRNQPSKFGFLRKSSQQALVVSTTSFQNGGSIENLVTFDHNRQGDHKAI